MENHKGKKMENRMETEGVLGLRELNFSYSSGETLSISIYIHYGNLI